MQQARFQHETAKAANQAANQSLSLTTAESRKSYSFTRTVLAEVRDSFALHSW